MGISFFGGGGEEELKGEGRREFKRVWLHNDIFNVYGIGLAILWQIGFF